MNHAITNKHATMDWPLGFQLPEGDDAPICRNSPESPSQCTVRSAQSVYTTIGGTEDNEITPHGRRRINSAVGYEVPQLGTCVNAEGVKRVFVHSRRE
jgi:hypothetical protein